MKLWALKWNLNSNQRRLQRRQWTLAQDLLLKLYFSASTLDLLIKGCGFNGNCIKCKIPIVRTILGQRGNEYHFETAIAVVGNRRQAWTLSASACSAIQAAVQCAELRTSNRIVKTPQGFEDVSFFLFVQRLDLEVKWKHLCKPLNFSAAGNTKSLLLDGIAQSEFDGDDVSVSGLARKG